MRKLRVFCNDPEATDSSSDEDYGRSREKPEKKKKCFMREITFPSGKEEAPPQEPPVLPPSTAVKYKGVRQRKWGKFASEIRHPINKARIWLGTFNTAEEAYQVYYMKKLEFDALRNLNKSSSSDMKSNDLAKVSVNDDLGVSENLNLGKSDNLVKLNVSDELGKSDDLGNLNVNDGGGKSDNLGNLKVNDDGGKYDNMGNLNVNDDLGKYDNMGNLNIKDDDVGKFHVLDSLNVNDDLGKSDNLGNSNVKDDDVGKFHVMDSLNVNDELGKFDDVGDLNDEDCGLKTGRIGGKEEEVVGEPFGVKRAKSGKWTARVTNPRTRERIWLGTFDSVEEAVRIYKKKESEFEGSYKKGKGRLSEEPCEGEAFGVEESKRRRFCSIVRDLGDGRWEGRVWHPKLKTCVLVGTYDSHKKAEIAAKLKKAQFQKRFRSKNAWVPNRKRDQNGQWECGLSNDWAGYEDREMVIGLAAPKLPDEGEALIERAKSSEYIKAMDDGTSGVGSLPAGVRMTKTGRFGAWVTNPVSGTEHCVRSYKTLEDAVKTVNKFFNSRKRASCPEIISTPKNKECRVSYGSPTSVLDSGIDNSTAVSAELTNEVDLAPVKLEHGLVHGLPTPVSEAERVKSEDVSVDKSRADDMTISENKQNLAPSSIFDEAVRLGIMNEYGQLLGEYSKYDEPMWLSNDEEEENATYYY